MAELSAIVGSLATNDSAATHPVGSTYTGSDTTYGPKRYVYLQEDGGCSKGDARVISETGLKAEAVASATLQQMPVIALIDVTDTYYSWYQYEGLVENVRACATSSLSSDLDTGDYLCLYAATNFVVGNSGVGSAFMGWMECRAEHPYQATSYTCATLDVYLRGCRAGVRPLD